MTHPPLYWNQAAAVALAELDPQPQLFPATEQGILKYIRHQCDEGLQAFRDRECDGILIDPVIQLGVLAAELLFRRNAWDVVAMHDLLVRKQTDYGHLNILNGGLMGVALRQADKVERYFNLKDREDEAANEPAIDALLDMVGYAAIGKMLTTTVMGDWCESENPSSRFRLELEPF